MPDIRVDELIKRSEAAWTKKANWDGTYKDAYKYGLPQRDLYGNPKPGQPKGDEVFDGTAVNATASFANRLQSGLCPPFRKWAVLEAGPLVPKDKREEANKLLQETTDKTFAVIRASNFDLAINEFFLDLAAGTAIMLVEEGDDEHPLRFVAVPQIQVALEEGPLGTIEGVFRRHKLPVRLIERTWKDAKLTKELSDKAQDDPEAEIELDEVTWFDADKGVFYYDVLDREAKESLLKKRREYQENPWIVCRWVKAANEVNGRGPLLFALPDIRTLNKLVELILKNASLAVSGAYTAVDDGVINPNVVRIVPGAVIPVARNPGHPQGASLAPLPRAGDFNIAQLEREDLRMQVKKALLDNSLPPDAGPVRSATEIMERMKALSEDIASAFGRIMAELIQPLFHRILGILYRKGLIDMPIKVQGTLVAVNVTSPLARLQNIDEVQAVIQWLQLISVMGPEMMMMSAKVEDIGAWIGQKLGVPQDLIRDEADRAKMQKQVAQIIAMNAAANNPAGAAAMGGGSAPANGGVAA